MMAEKERARRNAYQRKWRRLNPAKIRDICIRQSRMRRGQLGPPDRPMPAVCEVCARPNIYGARSMLLCEDHDHATGKPRGYLCHKCNSAIAALGDDLPGLARAVSYLERSGK